ncbi:MAG: fimbrillin family protein [Tidjanibacter sp.]|nr:fimbrillin family protein [Tidjanibacter sp.]
MKKLYALAAVVAVALTSCVKNEIAEPAGNEIAFKNFALSENTRGDFAEVADEFECFAIYEDENGTNRREFWSGAETIKKDGNTWSNSEDTYYWPKDGNLDFYAWYSPYKDDIDAKITASTDEEVGMTIADLFIDEAKELLVADPAKNLTKNDVIIIFRHTTSRLGFYFANANADAATDPFKLTINSIEVAQLNEFASYAYKDGKHEWTANTAKTPADKKFYTGNDVITTTKIESNTEATAQLELFPQAETVITIKYTVVDNNNFEYTGTYVINPTDTPWAVEANKWLANNDYHYNITFNFKWVDENGDGKKDPTEEDLEIHFKPEVEEWTVQTHTIYDERQ